MKLIHVALLCTKKPYFPNSANYTGFTGIGTTSSVYTSAIHLEMNKH
jgi:hypothetical protein